MYYGGGSEAVALAMAIADGAHGKAKAQRSAG